MWLDCKWRGSFDWGKQRKGTRAIGGNCYQSPGQREKLTWAMFMRGGSSWLKMLRVSITWGNIHQPESTGFLSGRNEDKNGLRCMHAHTHSCTHARTRTHTRSSIFWSTLPRTMTTLTIAHPLPTADEECLPMTRWMESRGLSVCWPLRRYLGEEQAGCYFHWFQALRGHCCSPIPATEPGTQFSPHGGFSWLPFHTYIELPRMREIVFLGDKVLASLCERDFWEVYILGPRKSHRERKWKREIQQ